MTSRPVWRGLALGGAGAQVPGCANPFRLSLFPGHASFVFFTAWYTVPMYLTRSSFLSLSSPDSLSLSLAL